MKLGFDGGIQVEFHGAKIVRHNRYGTFQMAEVMIDKKLFAVILARIERLRYYSA
jgi:hypothetical protein